MKWLNNLSEKEKNLIFILLIVLILVGSFQLGYVRLTEKADQLTSENQDLSNKLIDLQQKNANKKKYLEETKAMEASTQQMEQKLSTLISQEKSTMFVVDLEKAADMVVNAIAFEKITEIYSSDTAAQTEGENQTTTDAGTPVTVGDSVSMDALTAGDVMKGYQTVLTINFQTTYSGLKKSIDIINNNTEKMKILSCSASFDNTTGNLTGSMSIGVYALVGKGREVETMTVPGVPVGRENIFGTFEIPVQ